MDLKTYEFEKFKKSISFEDDVLIVSRNSLGPYQLLTYLSFHYENKDLIELISHRKFDIEIEKMTDDEWLEWLNLDDFKGKEWLRFRQFNKGLKKYEKELIIEFYTLLYFYVQQMTKADMESENDRVRKGFLIYVKAYRDEYKKLYKFFLDNELLEI